MVDVAVFLVGVAAGIAIHRGLSKNIYRQPWTICSDCRFRKQSEGENPIPYPQRQEERKPSS